MTVKTHALCPKNALHALAILALALGFALGGGVLTAQAKDNHHNYYAQNSTATGGYTGPGPSQVTVAQAKEMSDDAHVMLVGHIVQHLGKKEYLFKDDSGTVTLKIGRSKWGDQNIGPGDLVEIRGEVDKDFMEFEIDVYSIIKK